MTEIVQTKRTRVTHEWIIGLDHPVCLVPTTLLDDVNGSQPTGDNVVVLGLVRSDGTSDPTPEHSRSSFHWSIRSGSDWRVDIAGPNLVKIGYSLGMRYAAVAGVGDPTVVFGVPYGYHRCR